MLASVVNFFNPSLIVVGGGVAQSGDQLLAAIRETVYRRSLPLATRDLSIQRSSLGALAGVIGASAMVVEQLFSRDSLAAGSGREAGDRRAGRRGRRPEARLVAGDDHVGEVARRRILEDHLVAAVGQDLALDDDLALVHLAASPRCAASTPPRHSKRSTGSQARALRRPVAGVHHRVHDVAVVEGLRGARPSSMASNMSLNMST